MRSQRHRAGRPTGWILATVCALAAPTLAAEPAATHPTTGPAAVDPRADEAFRAASRYLADAKSYTFAADVWEDVLLPDGRKAQRQRTVHVGVRRPDHVFVDARTEGIARGVWYDGKTFTLFNRTKNFYGTLDAPNTIDKTVDLVSDKFGIPMPLSDLVVSNLYADAMKDVIRGDYLGRQKVGGVTCHHLAFVAPDVDWEAWVEEGAAPIIRRLVITYKEEPLTPQFTAMLSDWNFDARLPDDAFTFHPPPGASRIAVLEAKTPPPLREEPGDAARQAKQVQPPSDTRTPASPPQDKKD